MFSVGDTVVYGTQGVCRIKEISMLKLGKVKGEYYILTPISSSGSAVYVPADNEMLLSKMRAVLSREELDKLLDTVAGSKTEWIADDNSRKNYCDEVIKSGNREEILRLIGMLYERREDLKDQKKHFHNVDAQYLKAAERILHDEFAYILGIDVAEVPDYIRAKME